MRGSRKLAFTEKGARKFGSYICDASERVLQHHQKLACFTSLFSYIPTVHLSRYTLANKILICPSVQLACCKLLVKFHYYDYINI